MDVIKRLIKVILLPYKLNISGLFGSINSYFAYTTNKVLNHLKKIGFFFEKGLTCQTYAFTSSNRR